MSLRNFRSLKRGTVSLFRSNGCKVAKDDPIFQDSILDCTCTVIFGINVKLYILTCFQDALKIPNALVMIYHI